MSGGAYSVISTAALQWWAWLAYCLPLRRREKFAQRSAVSLAALLAMSAAAYLIVSRFGAHGGKPLTALLMLVNLPLLWLLVYRGVELNWTASLYIGIWCMITSQAAEELWWWIKDGLGMSDNLLAVLIVGASFCAAAHFTVGRLMPDNGTYDIGPRQLTSACLLGLMFSTIFAQLLDWRVRSAVAFNLLLVLLLCQFYCVSLLYLQTELFKKSSMQKELDALNILYERQREQYQVARQNVQVINRKCHELKVRVAELRRLMPEGVTPESLDEAESAARFYDATANTGNEVLDVVLTEKALLCESRNIQLNAVADGSCLRQFEPGDLYALFANALDYMIASAVYVNDPRRRMIDLLVCVRQNFILINIIGPERPPEAASGHAVDYEVKVVRRVVQKYDGTQTLETNNGFAALKIIFPQRNK